MGWLVVVIIVLLYLFFSTKSEEVARVNNEGGFYLKYKELIDYFQSIPNIKVEKKTSTSVILLVQDKFVSTRFTIGHGFEDVSVFWYHQSLTFGNHSLNWTFPENLPQSQMIRLIENDLEVYERNLLSNS